MFQLQLWSTKTGEQIVCFYHADKPVFTLDCKYLLYIDSGRTLIIYCLSRMAPMRYVACEADQLLVLPVKHRLVLMTNWPATSGRASVSPDVTLWDFDEGRQLASLSNVAAGGIQDISKDGMLAVDSDLQIFSLDTGELKSQIDLDVDGDPDFTFVRLTYDGWYVVWVDKLSVKVGRVSDGSLIAHTCTHERPTSLCMLDCGYVLVVGREDGRILMMRLLTTDHQESRDIGRSADDRCSTMRSRQMCSDAVKSRFDGIYRSPAQCVKDGDVPRVTESTRSILAQRAKAPLLSTAMSKPANATTDKFRRCYSHLTPISDLHHGAGSALTGSSSYHHIPSRTDDDDDDISAARDHHRLSADDNEVLTDVRDMLGERRSRSVTDVMALCTLGRNTDPPTPSTAGATGGGTPLRTPAHKFLGCFRDFGATIRRSRRKKYRRQAAAADTDNRDRMPSV